MSEEHTNEHREPFLGKLGATVTATVCGGVLVFALSAVVTAPQEADKDIIERLRGLDQRLRDHEAVYNEHRANSGADIKELAIQVDAGTDDRYTAKDAAKDFARIEAIAAEREQRTRSDISRIDGQLRGIMEYLTEEQREIRRNK